MSFKAISPVHDITSQNSQEARNRTNIVFIKPIEITGKIHTDQTGRFHVQSILDNQYFIICYNYDSNALLTAQIKSIEGPKLFN